MSQKVQHMDFYILYVVSRLSPSADLLEEVNLAQQHLQTKYSTLDKAGDQVKGPTIVSARTQSV